MNSLTEKHFDGGVTIIEQDKANDVFYIVKSGEVGVLQNDKEIATLKA
jgi:CRP-like cAMP-binding protein